MYIFSLSLLLSVNFLVCDSIKDTYNVFVIGDGHALFSFKNEDNFWENVNFTQRTIKVDKGLSFTFNISLQWLGSIQIRDIRTINFLEYMNNLDFNNLDAIIFSLGEVDTRYHISQEASLQNLPIEGVAFTLATDLCNMIIDIRNSHPEYKGKFVILAALPPTENVVYNPPHFSEVGKIIESQKALNKAFKELGEKNDILILDPYSYFLNKKNALSIVYSDNCQHLKTKYNYKVIETLYQLLK